jgi:hypothetical protein
LQGTFESAALQYIYCIQTIYPTRTRVKNGLYFFETRSRTIPVSGGILSEAKDLLFDSQE